MKLFVVFTLNLLCIAWNGIQCCNAAYVERTLCESTVHGVDESKSSVT